MISALREKGYFEDKYPHKLIVCGDLFDRGSYCAVLHNILYTLLVVKIL